MFSERGARKVAALANGCKRNLKPSCCHKTSTTRPECKIVGMWRKRPNRLVEGLNLYHHSDKPSIFLKISIFE